MITKKDIRAGAAGSRVPCMLLILSVVLNSGCSVYMASTQPHERDLSVLTVGTPRALVVSELGTPLSSEERLFGREDIYRFQQGYKKGTKVARAFFHGTADVFTLGLWEVFGTPIESYANGTKVAVRVVYDAEDHLKRYEVITGHEEFGNQEQEVDGKATVAASQNGAESF